MLIKKLTVEDINHDLLKKIYHWRFNVYSKYFSNDFRPSYKNHIEFLNRAISSTNEIWFGLFIYRNNDEMSFAGCASIYNFKNSECEFGRLMISPSHLGHSYSRKLIFFIINYVKDQLSADRIKLVVKSDNIYATNVYISIGFLLTKTGKLNEYTLNVN